MTFKTFKSCKTFVMLKSCQSTSDFVMLKSCQKTSFFRQCQSRTKTRTRTWTRTTITKSFLRPLHFVTRGQKEPEKIAQNIFRSKVTFFSTVQWKWLIFSWPYLCFIFILAFSATFLFPNRFFCAMEYRVTIFLRWQEKVLCFDNRVIWNYFWFIF